MKYDWINENYIYLNDDIFLNFSDLITILEIIRNINDDNNWKKQFYISLWESILKWIWSKYSIQNYLNKSFKLDVIMNNEDFLNIYNWILMMRESYMKVINCFSWDWVWNRWKNINSYNNFKIIDDELMTYKSTSKSLINNIKNLDLFLATNLWEDILKYISYKDLKEKYWLNINLEETRDKYFSY